MSNCLPNAAAALAVVSLCLFVAACSGSVQSSGASSDFNAEISRCDSISNAYGRNACAQGVMTRYSRARAGN